jgi:hypothetical protein
MVRDQGEGVKVEERRGPRPFPSDLFTRENQ